MNVLKQELEQAMRSESPLMAFRQTVARHLAQGLNRTFLTEELEKLRTVVESDSEDVILEVLDFIAGWCHPDMKL
ncbi:hypothetical protein ACFJIX_13110 [Roseateles sp. UC29_93]|uniref:hypothetical protein n=1 Tax=Roseateles sp. UC29_93 TaxID=3350177 RepID=UPI00366B0425